MASRHNVPCTLLSRQEMYELLGDVKHQGMAASMLPVPTIAFDHWAGTQKNSGAPALVLVLDHIQDPQNMGAIIRTAEVAGAEGVLFPERRGALPTEAVGLEPSSENLLWRETLFPPRLALVLGSEGKGLSRLIRERCDELVALPMRGATGSLNVSAAAAVGIFEWVRGLQQNNA